MNINDALRRMVFGACMALLGAHGVVSSAQAGNNATITFSDPNCASWSMTSGANNTFTLTCQSLNCSITASPGALVTPSTPIQVAPSCSPTPTLSATYAWTLVSGPAACPAPTATSTTNLLTASVVTPGGCVYLVNVSDPVLGKGQATINLDWETVTSPPSGCTVTASPTTIPATGGTVNLTAACGGGAVSTWTWTKNTAAFSTNTATPSDTFAANSGNTQTVTYAVTATNAKGSSTASAGVVWTGSGGGGGGGGPYSCSGFASTLSADWTWGAPGSGALTLDSSSLGAFGNNVALVIGVPVGSTAGGAYNFGHFTVAEEGSQAYNRVVVVSASPCDFSTTPPSLAPQGGSIVNGAVEPYLSFTVGVGTQSWYYFDMAINTKYYINIKNATSTGAQSCPTGASCPVRVELYKPSGL